MRREVDEVIDTDVLVIGSGGAGCWASISALEEVPDVTVVSKGLFSKSGSTIMSTGAVNIGIGHADPHDSPREHFVDTIVGGDYLNNQELVKVLTEEIIDRLVDIESFGFLYDRTEGGKLALEKTGGSRYPRTTMLGDWTGSAVMRVLSLEAVRRGANVLEEVAVTNLVKSDGRIVGALGLDLKNMNFIAFRASAVVLACGGAGQIYKCTSNPIHNTGDGYAMAYRAGAELIDMEMIQFHPTGLAYPEGKRGTLVTELCRSLGARLFNKLNERFMFRYDPAGELACRDVVARGIWREVKEGRGTPHGGAWLDCSYIPEEKRYKLRETYLKIREMTGLDMWKQRIEVLPTCHFFMGGVRINARAETTLPGLFACGEVTGGVHGANRLGANAIVEIFVFGYRAGKSAAAYAKSRGPPEFNWSSVAAERQRILRLFGEGSSPAPIRRKLQEVMWEYAGVERSEESLKKAEAAILRLMREADSVKVPDGVKSYRLDLLQAIELFNMLDTALMVVRSALYRRESRGAHYRADYPSRDDENWLYHTLVKQGLRGPMVSRIPVEIVDLKP